MLSIFQSRRGLLAISATFLLLLFATPLAARAQDETVGSSASRAGQSVDGLVSQHKADAQAATADRRANGEDKSDAARQAACERQEEKAATAMTKATERVTAHVQTLNQVLTRVQNFYGEGQFSVPDYEERLAAAVEAQTQVQLHEQATNQLNVKMVCEDPGAVATVTAFKYSASDAQDSLENYRDSLIDLVSSMNASINSTTGAGQ